MDKDDRAKMLKKPLEELIGSVGNGQPGSAFEYVLSVIINYKLQLRTIQATWILAFISIAVSLWSLWISYNQFKTENRPYIGLENLTGLSVVDTTGLKDNEGTTLNVFDETIKNYGHLPAFFKLTSTNDQFTCVESAVNQLMPEQGIEMHCERSLGTSEPGDKNICDTLLREEIHIEYGDDQDHLDYETILKMRLEDIPQSPTIKKLVRESVPKGKCGNDSGKNVQWYVASST